MVKVFKNADEIPQRFKGKLVVLTHSGIGCNHQLLRNVIDYDGTTFTFDSRIGYSYVEWPDGEFL